MIYILKSNTKSISYDKNLMQDVYILQLLYIKYISFFIKQDKLESFDYILITSKNSVDALLNYNDKNLFFKKPAIVIGNSSKKAWINAGGKVLFCPNRLNSGIQLADSIKYIVKGKNILYIHGKDIATDFKEILKNTCNIYEVIAYESCENKEAFNMNFKDNSIFIFGSPKHYNVFMKYYKWNYTWYAISLGNTTYNTFPDNIKKINSNGDFLNAIKLAKKIIENKYNI